MKKIIFLLSLAVFSAAATKAQTSFTLKLGGSFPMGDYGQADAGYEGIDRWGLVDRTKKGGAGTGIAIGGEWRRAITSVQGLGLTVSIDAIYNGVNSDLKDFFDEWRDDMEEHSREYSLHTPNYINVPVMLVLNYQHGIADNMGVFAGVGMGANVRYITPISISRSYKEDGEWGESETTSRYSLATTLAFRLGAGITFNKKYSLSLDYYILGAAKVKGEEEWREYYERETAHESDKFTAGSINPTMLLVRFGIAL